MHAHDKILVAFRPISFAGAVVGLASLSVLMAPDVAYALACGDPITEDTTLTPQDELLECVTPVVLLVDEDDVILDLAGFTISCSLSGKELMGTGIHVTGSGATVRHGRIKNCLTGVLVEGDGSFLESLTVTSSPGASGDEPGFNVQSDDNILLRNIVRIHPGEGFKLEGNSNVLQQNKAIKTGDHGFEVRDGENNSFLLNEAKGNDGDGFRSRGGANHQNQFFRNTAKNNVDIGIQIRGGDDLTSTENLVIGNIVQRNGLNGCEEDMDAGIAIRDASNNEIIGNNVKSNCIGIDVREGSMSNGIIGNFSRKNTLDMLDNNDNCDDNKWLQNNFRTSEPPDDPCIQ